VFEWVGGWIDGWMDGWMEREREREMGELISLCEYLNYYF
jgi:hypothetical protein